MGLQGRAGVHRQRSKWRGRCGARWREEEGKEGDEANRWGRAISETGKRAGDARAGPLAELGKRRLSGERAGRADAASGREETGPGSLGLAEKKGKGARAGLRKGARAGLKEGLG